ncbi:hypothetical protein SAMN02910263_04382 [Butyrivibrio sp. INlla16]|nr:hypothetical protein SAMN02910263_04382 [Butyrivibrio sp. INlla16]
MTETSSDAESVVVVHYSTGNGCTLWPIVYNCCNNLKSKIFLIMKLALFIVTLTAAIISQNIKAILAVIVGTIVATCVNYGILNALDEK